MKRKIGFIATLVIMLCLMACMVGMSASAAEVVETGKCGAEGDNVTYTLYDDGELIISGEGDMQNYDSKTAYFQNLDVKNVIINSGVTSIGEYAFYNSDTIMSITISESVTNICERAFYDCINLINITLPKEVTNIGVCAFYGCDSILNITIPSGVTNIGVWAFSNCLSLENIVVDSDNDYYSSIDGVLFDKNNSKLIQYPIGNTRTSYTIPDNVKAIGDSAFEYCDNLMSITIPDGVTTIGSYAFKYCTELISISMPDSITWLANYAFERCHSLKNVVIPNGVKTIYRQTFMYCYSLENVVIPDGVTSIGENAFAYCDSLTDITIPHSVTSIGRGAFSYSSNLKNIIVDDANDSYSSIDGVLFNEDKTEIICCPSGNTRISYSIPESVNVIGYQAFNECETLTNITIPSSVTSICDGAFHLCKGLISITIPDSVTSIGKGVFSNCENLMSVNLSENITSISDSLFYVCRNLTSITIPNGVKSIGKDAFASCSKLTDITIPDSVEDIGSRAFYFCSFKNITIPEVVKSIGDNAFYGSDLTTVTIPNGITCINEGTFEACDKLASITIPESVISIGMEAFDRCNSLTDVYYGGNSEQWGAVLGIEYVESCPNAIVHCAVEIGSCGAEGDNVKYILYDNGKLVISGTGKIYDYDNFSDFSPFYKSDIKTVVIEVGITSIGDGIFEQCDSLEEVVIPDGVTRIGDSAFYSCSSLPNVTIPYGVKIIGDNTFSDCGKFTSITIPDSVTSIGICAFSRCEKITSIVIPDSVVTLGRGAFDRCSAATSITIGKSVCSIGISTFDDCNKIESIYIPASVTSIESSAFSDWHSLKEIIVDENNENYISEQGVLFNKDKTQLVKYPSSKEGTIYTVPESVESFGEYEVFGHCKYLKEIIIGSRVTALGNFIFQDCKNLKKVEILGELITVDLAAFWGCNSLNDITLPDSVENIGSLAFSDCDSLTSINIPKSVMCIEKSAFNKCDALKDIYYTDSEESWNEILIEEENDPLYTATIHYYANCKHTEDGYESVIIEENRIEPTYSESGSYDEVSVCGRCGVELSRETKEIPASWLSKISCSFDNGVLTVSGTGEIPEDLAKYPWSQYAKLTETMVLDGVSLIGSNAFTEFSNLKTVIINGEYINVDPKAFVNCSKLNMIVSYAELNLDSKINSGTDIPVKIFVDKAKNFSKDYIQFEFVNNSEDGSTKPGVFVDAALEFTEEEFKRFIVSMYYGSKGNFYTLTFNELKAKDFQIYEYTKIDPFEAIPTDYVTGREIALVMYYDGDYYGLTGFETFCNTIITSGEEVEFDYKFVVVSNTVNEDGTEEEPGFFEPFTQFFATIFEAIEKMISWLIALFN